MEGKGKAPQGQGAGPSGSRKSSACDCPSDTTHCSCPDSRTSSMRSLTATRLLGVGGLKSKDYSAANIQLTHAIRSLPTETRMSIQRRTPGVAFEEERRRIKAYQGGPSPYAFYPQHLLAPNILKPPTCAVPEEKEPEVKEEGPARKKQPTLVERLVADEEQRRKEVEKKLREQMEVERERLCIFCKRRPRSVMVQPCMHMAACSRCCDFLLYNSVSVSGSRVCPVCFRPAMGRVLRIKC